jgi:hypothetical protein
MNIIALDELDLELDEVPIYLLAEVNIPTLAAASQSTIRCKEPIKSSIQFGSISNLSRQDNLASDMTCLFKGADLLDKDSNTFAANKNLEVLDIDSKSRTALFQDGENDESKTPQNISADDDNKNHLIIQLSSSSLMSKSGDMKKGVVPCTASLSTKQVFKGDNFLKKNGMENKLVYCIQVGLIQVEIKEEAPS